MASIIKIIGDTVGKQFQTEKEEEKKASYSNRWKTKSATESKSFSYATRVSAAFAMTAAMTALILVTVLAVVWDNQFQNYTRANVQKLASSTAESLSETYNLNGAWTQEAINQLSYLSASYTGLGIQLLNESGVPIFDNTWAASPVSGTVPLQNPGTSPVSLAPGQKSMEVARVVDAAGELVGMVRIWTFGSEFFLTQSDLTFRANSYRAIFVAAIIAIILALALGFLFSRGLVKPVRRVAETAEKIKDGNLSARTGLSGNDEIAQLGEIFDAMANSLEKDRELERRLTTDVAHELRTPLMAILATVEAIQDGIFPADEERLATIGGETRRLSRLVDALLQLSRLESGATKFDYRMVNIVELSKSIARAHEAMVSEAGMHLSFENTTGKDELMIEMDQDRIRQAVVNLLSNAIRYSDSGGEIELSVGADKKHAWICVKDSGIGISAEDLDRVFGRFWRAEASRNRAQGGLGVGLAVTKEVIERHFGYIQVESELGKGTSFTIVLPKMQPKALGKDDDKGSASVKDPSLSGKIDFNDIRRASRQKEQMAKDDDIMLG